MAACLALTSAAPTARPLPSDAFVWQLAWRPAVSRAVAGNAGLFAAWHVLVADFPEDGKPALPHPDWHALRAGDHAAIPVVRIEGRMDRARTLLLVPRIGALLAGLPAGPLCVEVDHDAPTARLAEYTAFLHALRAFLPTGARIWITVLPTWIASPDFPSLAAVADRLVLQVHAIDDPRLGLFSASRALAFTRALSRRVRNTPFQVALPAYGARVSPATGGLSVSAETAAADGVPGQEIAADPAEVARLVAELRRDPPDRLLGLAWFRLPVDGDARAWGAATLRRVAAGGMPDGQAVVAARPGQVRGARDIIVRNAGPDDVALPRRIVLPDHCLAADGLGQYVLEPGQLSRRGAGLLGGGAVVLAGWMRCSGDVHAEN